MVSGTNANVQDVPTAPTNGYTNSFTNVAAGSMIPPAVVPGWGSDAMKFTTSVPNNAVSDYWRWVAGNGTGNGASRPLQAADFIEYDVYVANSIDGIGGIDIKTNKADTVVAGCTGTCSYFRNWTPWADQNGVSGNRHSSTNGIYGGNNEHI
jgi:hypothetical protein